MGGIRKREKRKKMECRLRVRNRKRKIKPNILGLIGLGPIVNALHPFTYFVLITSLSGIILTLISPTEKIETS